MGVGKKNLLCALALVSYCINTATPVFSDMKEQPRVGNTAVIRSVEKPCSSNETVHKVTSDELSEKVKDFDEGDPLFYSLFSIFSGAKKDTCYYAEGKDFQKIFLNKTILDLSDTELRDGKTFYKTRAPVDEIKWVSAKLSGGDIKVSSRLHSHFVRSVLGSKVFEIPKTLDFTIYTAYTDRTEGDDGGKNQEEYDIFFAYENVEEPFVSELVTFLTGLKSDEMRVKKHDRKANRREAYKTLHYLHKKGLITIY